MSDAPRNGLGLAVLGLIVSGAGAWMALRRTWSAATIRTADLPSTHVVVTGADAVSGAVGLAIVIMAAAAGVLAAGPRLRRVIGGLVVLSGVTAIVAVVSSVGSMADSRRRAIEASAAAGFDGSIAWSMGPWPWVVVAFFALAVVVGGWIAWRGPQWPTMGRRYEAPTAREPEPSDLWKAMDAGEDPTV